MTFWHGRKVLLTGHTGFKGSWLSLWLQSLGADLIGLALPPPTVPSLFTLANVDANMTSIIGDVRDFDMVQKVVNNHQPDIIIHMAAQPLVRYSYRKPVETYATNVMGTVHILEAARLAGCVKTIINVTTDKCYSNKEWHWGYRENDALGGYDPYSNSKACSELVTSAYRSSWFHSSKIGLASARAGNVIGGGDWALDRLIPDIIRACLEKKPVFIRNPDSLRPWQHVLEPLSGYLLLAEKLYNEPLIFADGWNFGPADDDVKPVCWIADYVINHWGDGRFWQLDGNQFEHEATYLKLDCSKANSLLNWKPHWKLEKGLLETISWYQAFEQKQNMRQKTLAQIQEFISTHNALTQHKHQLFETETTIS